MAKSLYIHQLPAGTNFTWMNRHFIINDNRLLDVNGNPTNDITNGFVKTQEIIGLGTTHSWLGQPDRFHADVGIERPDLLQWLNS